MVTTSIWNRFNLLPRLQTKVLPWVNRDWVAFSRGPCTPYSQSSSHRKLRDKNPKSKYRLDRQTSLKPQALFATRRTDSLFHNRDKNPTNPHKSHIWLPDKFLSSVGWSRLSQEGWIVWSAVAKAHPPVPPYRKYGPVSRSPSSEALSPTIM